MPSTANNFLRNALDAEASLPSLESRYRGRWSFENRHSRKLPTSRQEGSRYGSPSTSAVSGRPIFLSPPKIYSLEQHARKPPSTVSRRWSYTRTDSSISSADALRGVDIESLVVGYGEIPGLSRITILVDVEDAPIEQVTKQLNKPINVIKIVVIEVTGDSGKTQAFHREVADRRARA